MVMDQETRWLTRYNEVKIFIEENDAAMSVGSSTLLWFQDCPCDF